MLLYKQSWGICMNIYDVLREKSFNKENSMNDAYICIDENDTSSYTYSDLYNLINKYVVIFKELDLKGKIKYLIVDNSIESLAIFIALLQCGAVPILIDKRNIDNSKKVYDEYDENIDNFEMISKYPYDYIIANNSDDFSIKELELQQVKKYIDSINKYSISSDSSIGDFYMCTSGTTGIPKLVKLNENMLMQHIENRFCNTKGYSCYCYNSIASIMGLTFYLLPILLDNKLYFYINEHLHKYFEHMFEEISKYNINHFMLPRNFLDYFPNEHSKLNFENLKIIYLTGEVNDYSLIEKIRSTYNLPKNVFVNLYGSTEMYGGICKCIETDIKKIYVNIWSLLNNKLIYTYDKKKIYSLTIENNIIIKRKIDIQFFEDLFTCFIPVSNGIVSSLSFKNKNLRVVDELLYNGKETGDLGFYVDNKLYILGRKCDIVNVNNKKYLLTALDLFFDDILGFKSSVIKIDSLDTLLLIVNYNLDIYSFDNFKKIIPIVNKCRRIINEINLPIEGPLFIASDLFPKSKSLRKTLRDKLKDNYYKLRIFDYYINNYEYCLVSIVKKYLYEITGLDVNVLYREGYIYVSKDNNIDINCIIELLKIIGYDELKVDDNTFSFKIDDSILFECFPKWNQLHFNYSTIEYLKKKSLTTNFIEKLNKQLCRNNNITNLRLIVQYFIDDRYVYLKFTKIFGITNNYDYKLLINTEMDFINSSCKKEEMICIESSKNVWYSEEELQERLEFYEKYFNHEYIVKRDLKDCYVDGIKNNEIINDCVILETMNNINRNYKSIDRNLFFDIENDKNLIITNSTLDLHELRHFPSVSLLRNFNINGYMDVKHIIKNVNLEFEDFAEYIARFNAHLLHIDNPLLIVYDVEYLRLFQKRELAGAIEVEKYRQLELFIDKLKSHSNITLYIDSKKYNFDFSKLKILYIINDNKLYDDPSLENMRLLGYLECLYNNEITITRFDDYFKKVKVI